MARVKKKQHEKLTSANVSKVIGLLEQSKPITKKEACQLLNISYNTTRLGKIIAEHKEKEAFVAKRKSQNRGKPATKEEIRDAITEYLSGENYANISKRLFRSSGFVKSIIERVGVPQKLSGDAKRQYDYLPENCVSETFVSGQIVWSAKYHATAQIIKETPAKADYLGKTYKIYVIESIDASDSFFPFVERGGFYAFQPAVDLGSLEHLKDFGVDLTKI